MRRRGSWASDVIDPTAVTSLNLYWGVDSGLANTGTLLASVAVPEPSAIVLGVSALGLTLVRRRR